MNDFGELDQKDLRILELEECISKFKEYDKKRKEYYSDVLIELGKLHSELIEFKETNDYYNKIKSLKSTIKGLTKTINDYKARELVTLNPQLIKEINKSENYKKVVSNLRKKNKMLVEENKILISKLINHDRM